MRYRIIALDVDGTLLNDEHQMTEPTKRTLRRVASIGAQIVLCTGRSPVNTLPLMEELGIEGVAITHNGAVTVRSRDRQVLQECAFSAPDISPYIESCRVREDVHFDVCTAFQLFVDKLQPHVAEMYRKFELLPEQVADTMDIPSIVKMSVFGEPAAIDQLHQQWETSPPGSLTIIRSGANFVDVMHPEATKGRALRKLAEEWQVPREAILAMGNYYNDQEMLEFAGMGIAVANSPEPLKQAADQVGLSNNDDGVHAALLEHVFGESY